MGSRLQGESHVCDPPTQPLPPSLWVASPFEITVRCWVTLAATVFWWFYSAGLVTPCASGLDVKVCSRTSVTDDIISCCSYWDFPQQYSYNTAALLILQQPQHSSRFQLCFCFFFFLLQFLQHDNQHTPCSPIHGFNDLEIVCFCQRA